MKRHKKEKFKYTIHAKLNKKFQFRHNILVQISIFSGPRGPPRGPLGQTVVGT